MDNMVHGLRWPDALVVGGAIGLLLLIAYLSGRRERSTRDFFLGGRRVPWFIACFSFVATEVSAVTIVAVPAEAFSAGQPLRYLQMFVGSAAARIFVAFLFIPFFYRYDCTSIYQFLRHRFGASTQYAGSAFFFITRILASAVRLTAACVAIAVIMNWSFGQTLLLFTIVSIAFIAFGGIKAVVWTGAYAAGMFYLAGAAVATYLLLHIDGGLSGAWHAAAAARNMHIFNTHFNFNDPQTVWAAGLNAFFVGLAVFGTDQELVQRLLTVKTRGRSQGALVGTIVAGLPLTCLYLTLGVLFFVFCQQGYPQPESARSVLAHFVTNVLPVGMKGLVLAAIILASIDSPLSSLSSSFVMDIYRPLIRKRASEGHYLWVSRIGVVGFGIILALLAYSWQHSEDLLWIAFQVLSLTGGSTLGAFLLGLLPRWRRSEAAIAGMVTSAVVCTTLFILIKTTLLALGWSWLIVIGTVLTFLIGWVLGMILDAVDPKPPTPAEPIVLQPVENVVASGGSAG